jgi:hypothetical protein
MAYICLLLSTIVALTQAAFDGDLTIRLDNLNDMYYYTSVQWVSQNNTQFPAMGLSTATSATTMNSLSCETCLVKTYNENEIGLFPLKNYSIEVNEQFNATTTSYLDNFCFTNY